MLLAARITALLARALRQLAPTLVGVGVGPADCLPPPVPRELGVLRAMSPHGGVMTEPAITLTSRPPGPPTFAFTTNRITSRIRSRHADTSNVFRVLRGRTVAPVLAPN